MSDDFYNLTIGELLARGYHPVIYGSRDVAEQEDRDAHRYRWLRDKGATTLEHLVMLTNNNGWDDLIDKAMADEDRYELTDAGRTEADRMRAAMNGKLGGKAKAGEP